MDDLISRQAAIKALEDAGMTNYQATGDFYGIINALTVIKNMPTAEQELIRCKDCEYGEQDEEGWWYCSDLGCQMGDEDGSGFCSDAERRSDE